MEYKSIEQCVAGKTAVITGGTSGIGKACVEIFCAAGVNVVTMGRSVSKGEALEARINRQGKGNCRYFPCDVKDTDRLREIIENAAEIFGGIDILLNCAGYFPSPAPIDRITKEMFQDVIDTNLTAYFMGCKYTLPYLRTAKGCIINIGSIVAVTGGQGCQAYCCTKGAIEAFTRSLAIDESRNGVRVNEIKPGHIVTEISDQLTDTMNDRLGFSEYMDHVQFVGRGGKPEEIAYAALFFASDWSAFTTGVDLCVSGGYELGEAEKKLSKFLDWPAPVTK
jgi:NAD(P)-dependent dehydrogenase (short-subunit alcohol dehydrogenase family)